MKSALWSAHRDVAKRVVVDPVLFAGWCRNRDCIADAAALERYCEAVHAAWES
jgi:hypothetical protein